MILTLPLKMLLWTTVVVIGVIVFPILLLAVYTNRQKWLEDDN